MNDHTLKQDARVLLDHALRACSVAGAFERKLQVEASGQTLRLSFGETVLDLTGVRHLRIVAAGKAAAEMLDGLLSRMPLPQGCDLQGVLIGHTRPDPLPDRFSFFAGGHPLPNQASFDGAQAALNLVRETAKLEHAYCLFLISGGASSMMELPLDPTVTLEETRLFYQALVHSGARIGEINCLRKHFSAIKGGRLAQAAGATPTLTLLVSDVPPNQLDALASGPTLPDSSTVEDCRRLLTAHSLDQVLPATIRRTFRSTTLAETPKPGEIAARAIVLLDSNDLASAARASAEALGYHVIEDNRCDDWSYSAAADYLLERLRALRQQYPRLCLLSTGEVVVSVAGHLVERSGGPEPEPGHGGRNQHFALYAATQLLAHDAPVAILSAGSDGIDGNSPAAGALVSSETLSSLQTLTEARLALNAFDSFTFLDHQGATIVTGPTGNNLRDLRVLLTG